MALPEQIKNDSDVRIDPDLDPTVPIIDTSGNLVPGVARHREGTT